MLNTFTIHTNTAEETRRVGQTIGESASPGDVYLLTGPLGAGKTCLTQGIARGLNVDGYARSPTFVLMTRYQGRLTLHHADLYRIDHPAEAWDLGFEDIIAAGQDVLIVEWADRADELFPEDALWIELDYALDEFAAPCEVIPDEDGAVPARHSITIEDAPERFAGLLQELEATAL
ncbi:MAG: tRNA (adenosine(37)-N6)-threonylcarbamoyltransferase complex ATPase subunit type 1 TsaE [Chloroflexota bacterium]|nr:tRNA (adenosine(37)-N6)-threonylcarbamoyltransferase complex ATPase subunit type 1 TsaE [Chloroflexota bacterium]MDE2685598.1 tRNA (adenosine(37)-N6)-threonylcarbamoyltransferase complex ATPase subunit type 1 TsaE [Chloroflexota bacterium]